MPTLLPPQPEHFNIKHPDLLKSWAKSIDTYNTFEKQNSKNKGESKGILKRLMEPMRVIERDKDKYGFEVIAVVPGYSRLIQHIYYFVCSLFTEFKLDFNRAFEIQENEVRRFYHDCQEAVEYFNAIELAISKILNRMAPGAGHDFHQIEDSNEDTKAGQQHPLISSALLPGSPHTVRSFTYSEQDEPLSNRPPQTPPRNKQGTGSFKLPSESKQPQDDSEPLESSFVQVPEYGQIPGSPTQFMRVVRTNSSDSNSSDESVKANELDY